MSFVVWKFNQLSLPLEFGPSVLTAGTARLYFHALRIMAALIVAMVVARYWSQRAKVHPHLRLRCTYSPAAGVSDLSQGMRPPLQYRRGGQSPKLLYCTVLAVRAGASCHHRYSVGKIPRERCWRSDPPQLQLSMKEHQSSWTGENFPRSLNRK